MITLISIGDVSASFDPNELKNETIVHLSGQWRPGIAVRMVNPFHIEPFQIAVNEDQTEIGQPESYY